MENKNATSIKFKNIKNKNMADDLYKEMKQAFLELRLAGAQKLIKNYVSQKRIMRKNMARALTYIIQNNTCLVQ
jgi:ribosomal protein L29